MKDFLEKVSGISRVPKVIFRSYDSKFFEKLISRPIHLFGKLGFLFII